ncbi:MAG: ATPase, partial [Candidatus Paceibacter sp.]|nr:ATPase [Candidatus Paceibacter sp.]
MTQQEALDILKLGHNVYLTGSAGSGKTYVLNQYIKYLRDHEVDVGITASTGIAATHMNGMTIHSWCGLGIRDTLSPQDIDAMEEKRYLWTRLQNTKVLIIDEVSMLHHFRLDLIEQICRAFKRNNKPFGGLQVVLCGDFFQLPPVARRGEDPAHFIYHSKTWENMDINICYLHEQHRQKDDDFLQVLNEIRASSVSAETLNLLTARFNKDPETSVRATKLYTHNVDVDAINNAELEQLDGVIHEYMMSEHGREHL